MRRLKVRKTDGRVLGCGRFLDGERDGCVYPPEPEEWKVPGRLLDKYGNPRFRHSERGVLEDLMIPTEEQVDLYRLRELSQAVAEILMKAVLAYSRGDPIPSEVEEYVKLKEKYG